MAQDSLFGGEHPPVFSVGEFLDFINELFGAQSVYVQGEVTKWNVHPKGVFFTLKDDQDGAVLEGYLSPYAYRGLGFQVEVGMVIKVGGIPNIWKNRGQFSLKAETVEPYGEGTLKKAYQLLKKKLQDEGLFDRKRPLPEFITTIGVITSGSGAVIDDFCKNLLPLGLRVIMKDVRVQGSGAMHGIRSAVELFQAQNIDVLVVMRGGGSAEDLDVFNDEHVVRAVFGSRIPVIAAIGHHRDVPLATMVADASPSTPSIAAGIINASWDRLRNIDQTAQRLQYVYQMALGAVVANVHTYTHRLTTHMTRVASQGIQMRQRLLACAERVGTSIAHANDMVTAAERHLAGANPERLLRLGYSIVTDATGSVVRSMSQLRHGQEITTRLGKGAFTAEVKELQSES